MVPIITPPRHDSVPSSDKVRSEIKPSVMPYALKFYLYLFVAGVVMVVVAARWLAPYGWGVNLLFSFAEAYLAIVIGRRVLGRKNL